MKSKKLLEKLLLKSILIREETLINSVSTPKRMKFFQTLKKKNCTINTGWKELKMEVDHLRVLIFLTC